MKRLSTIRAVATRLCLVVLVVLAFGSRVAVAACPETVGAGSPISYEDCREFSSTNPGTNSNLGVSTSLNTQVGDYQIMFVARKSTSASATINTPAGWTAVLPTTRNGANGNNDVVMAIFSRRATVAGTENFNIVSNSGAATNDMIVTIMRFRNTAGADSSSGASATNAPGASATISSPQITTTQHNSLVLRMVAVDDDDQNNSEGASYFNSTTITLEESQSANGDGNNNNGSITVLATRAVQANAGQTAGVSNFNNGSSEEWISHAFALLPSRTFQLSKPATIEACQIMTMTIRVRDPLTNATDTGYAGTIQLSTSTNHGWWTTTGGSANGTLVPGNGNGTASYTFVPADNGQITLQFYNPNVEDVNFDIVDSSGYREDAAGTSDASVAFTACGAGAISIGIQSCTDNTSFSYSIPSNASENRMVLVVVGGEDNNNRSAATATFNGVGMQSLGFAKYNGSSDVYAQAFALNHAALPGNAGSYNISVSGTPTDSRICAYVLTGVKQQYPQGQATSLPVNGSTAANSTSISTTITREAAYSYVFSMVSSSNGNAFNPRGDGLTETEDANVNNNSAQFSVASALLEAAGSFTATSTSGNSNNNNRKAQLVTAFAPLVEGGYYKISHAGIGPMCGAAAITISATDGMGVLDTAYTGTIRLNTSGNLGTWSAPPGTLGTFVDQGNGQAEYTFAAGDLGDVVLYYTPASTGTVNFDVTDLSEGLRTVLPFNDPDLTFEPCEYRISVPVGSGATCSVSAITFAVVTSSGAPVLGFTGTINLGTSTTQTDKGSWTLASGGGTLIDATPKDGAATYTFVAADNGVVTLNFASDKAGSYNYNVTGGGYNVNASYDPNFSLQNCKFIVSYDTSLPTDICTPQRITIKAATASGAVVTTFNKQVLLSTTTSHGTWSLDGSQSGSLNDPIQNDGAASYTFAQGDAGQVTLIFNGSVAETLKVRVKTLDGAMNVDTVVPANDPFITLALCSFRISLGDGELPACSVEDITLGVYNSSGALAQDYTGTVNLSTSTTKGSWAIKTAQNAIVDPVSDDGAASYTFDTQDNGQIVLSFSSTTVETLDVNVADQYETYFRESPGYDPQLSVTSCHPSVKDSVCWNVSNTPKSVAIPAEIPGLESRMVLLYTMLESSSDKPINARLTQGATNYGMTKIREESASNVTLQVWGILGADLPDQAVTLSAAITDPNSPGWRDGGGNTRNPSICLVVLEGVEQPNLSTLGTSTQVDGTATSGTANDIRTITTTRNSSIVIGAAATGSDAATSMLSSLATSLWNLDSGQTDAPTGANFNGDTGLQPTAATIQVKVDTNGGVARFAHIALALGPIVEGQPYGDNFVPVTLYRTLAGNISYRAIGASFRTQPNTGNSCTMGSTATATLPLPAGSSIVTAYVFWGASGDTPDIDNTVNFGPAGSLSTITADEVFQVKTNIDQTPTQYFLGYKEVTPLILGNQTNQQYSMTGLSARTNGNWALVSTCTAGWGMVVVFENENTEPYVNVINLFHGFQPFQNSSFTLVPRNFRMAEPDPVLGIPRGYITHITFEGDDDLNNGTEVFELQSTPGQLMFDTLHNASNVGNDQYNDTVTYPNFAAIGTYDPVTDSMPYITQKGNSLPSSPITNRSYGLDVDTYFIAGSVPNAQDVKESILYPFGQQQAEQITTRYSAGQDLVLLAAEFIEVTNSDLADLEIFVEPNGTFTVNDQGEASLRYRVVNNGNNAISNGYATGTVVLTGRMPTGIAINSIPAPDHWSCSVSMAGDAFTCTLDIESWPNGTVNNGNPAIRQLDDVAWAATHSTTAELPVLDVLVNVGNDTVFPNQSNAVQFVGRIAHFATPLDCTPENIGYQPDPTTCTQAGQFDNVNDLNKNTIDIDDLSEKSAYNNNVARGSFAVFGIRTDLAMDIEQSGALQQGLPATFQLRVSNNGPDATTKPMTVTATFPTGVVPVAPTPPGWTCNVVGQLLTCVNDPLQVQLTPGANTTIVVTTTAVSAVEGDTISTTASVSADPKNFDTVLTNNSDTVISEVVGDIEPINERFLLSTNEAATLGGVSFENEDLLLYDPATDTASLFLDTESLPNTTPLDVDDMHLLPNGWIVLSAKDSGTFLGVPYDDEDLILYDPILGTASVIFDGSDPDKFGAGASAADVDAFYIDYNDSYDPDDWVIYLSTENAATLNGVPFDNNDIVTYVMNGGATALVFNGSDADKFGGAEGNIGGFYIRYDDPDLYYMTSSDAGNTTLDTETYTSDDIVNYDNGEASPDKAQQVFDGNGLFDSADPEEDRAIDGIHVVEEGYYGHFAIVTLDGNICNMGTVTISKHQGLTHNVDTGYVGSVRITATSATAGWFGDVSNKGTLQDLGNGVALYTFHSDDNGVVVLHLGEGSETLNIGIDVTNGVSSLFEKVFEEQSIDIHASVLPVSYFDNFDAVFYGGGSSNWSGPWAETNDDGTPVSGNIKVVSGKVRMSDPSGNLPSLTRGALLNFTPNTLHGPFAFNFRWARPTAGVVSFRVQHRLNGGSWSSGTLYGNASGIVTERAETYDLSGLLSDPAWLSNADNSVELRFAMVSGSVFDYVTLDEVAIEAVTDSQCNAGASVDHYVITHSGTMLSCLAQDITITAVNSLGTPVTPGANVTLTLGAVGGNGAMGAWNFAPSPTNNGAGTYVWPGNISSITVPFNYTDLSYLASNDNDDVITLTAMDSNGVGAVGTLPLQVQKAGLLFWNQTTGTQVWPTQVSGMNSLAYTGQELVVKAVVAGTENPSMCQPLFDAGQVLPVELVFECEDPLTCSPDGGLQIVTVSNPQETKAIPTVDSNGGNGASGNYTPIDLLFEDLDGNGDIGARLELVYPDAGLLQIHGRYDVPFNNDSSGASGLSGDYMTGSGPSFVVRPFGYGVDFNGDFDNDSNLEYDRLQSFTANAGDITQGASWAVDANGTRFLRAGETFQTSVKAVSWQAQDDLDNNGVPDAGAYLFDNAATPNYGREIVGGSSDATLTHALVALPGGNQGVLTGTAFSGFSADGLQTNTLTFSEVGIIDLTATLDDTNGYLGSGESVIGFARNVGRFIPAYFEVSGPGLIPRPAFSSSPSASIFTYMGEEFGATFTLTARNLLGATTENYRSVTTDDCVVDDAACFAKLTDASNTGGQFQFYAVETGTEAQLTQRLNRNVSNDFPGNLHAEWGAGTPGAATLSGHLIFDRPGCFDMGPPEAPRDIQIAVTVVDSDGVEDTGRSVSVNDLDDGGCETNWNFSGNNIANAYNLIGTLQLRYGRMVLENAYASELQETSDDDDNPLTPEVALGRDLLLPFSVEYFDGNDFVVNGDDSLTTFDFSHLHPVPGSYNLDLSMEDGQLDPGEFDFDDTSVSTVLGGQVLEQGGSDYPFQFTAPGAGNHGTVLMEYDLSSSGANYPFLTYRWRGDGDLVDEFTVDDNEHDDSPRAMIEFGTFGGNERIINWQELFLDENPL